MVDKNTPIAPDIVGLLEGISTTRAIRRYLDEPIPDEVLRDIMFAATRAPSGSNRQPFRFIVLADSEIAQQAKTLIATGAQKVWNHKRTDDAPQRQAADGRHHPEHRIVLIAEAEAANGKRLDDPGHMYFARPIEQDEGEDGEQPPVAK